MAILRAWRETEAMSDFDAMRSRTCSLSDGLLIAVRSAPDEKWPPAPVRIAQRISGVSST